MIDGFNTQLSDIDFYDATTDAVSAAGMAYDVTHPSYFRKNPFIKKLTKMIPS